MPRARPPSSSPAPGIIRPRFSVCAFFMDSALRMIQKLSLMTHVYSPDLLSGAAIFRACVTQQNFSKPSFLRCCWCKTQIPRYWRENPRKRVPDFQSDPPSNTNSRKRNGFTINYNCTIGCGGLFVLVFSMKCGRTPGDQILN